MKKQKRKINWKNQKNKNIVEDFEEWAKSNNESNITLTEDDDGELILSKEDEEFRIVYDKKTKKKN